MNIDNQSLFNEQAPAETQPNQQQNNVQTDTPSPMDDLLKGITNEQGKQKYSSVDEALRGAAHAQEHIRNLTTKHQTLERQLAQREAEFEELKRQVAERFTKKEDPLASKPEHKEFNPEDFEAIVERKLQQAEAVKIAQANQAQVVQALKKQFGDKAEEVFYSKAAEYAMDKDSINQLAARSPQAVLAMFGVSGAGTIPNTAPIQTKVNTAVDVPSGEVSAIGRETTQSQLGEGFERQQQLRENSVKMLEALSERGMNVHDLTDPKVFFKLMK